MNFVNDSKSGFQPDSAGEHLVRRGTDRQAGSLTSNCLATCVHDGHEELNDLPRL
jgi:hypothetical protein